MRLGRKRARGGGGRQGLGIAVEERIGGVAQRVRIDRIGMLDPNGGAQLFGEAWTGGRYDSAVPPVSDRTSV